MDNRPSNSFRHDFVLYIKELWAASKPVFKKWWVLLNIPVAIVDVIALYFYQDIPSSNAICAGTTTWIVVTLFYAGFQVWREMGQAPDQSAGEVTPDRPLVEIDPKERRYLDGRLRVFEQEEVWYTELAGDATIESRLDVFRDDYTPDQPSRETYTDIREAIDDLDRFVLVGDPGAGKTSTLRKLATDMARARLAGEKAPLPLWVHLGTETDATNAGELLRHWWQEYGLPDTVEGYLNNLDLCLFLDGLDEMPGSADWAGSLRDLVKQHPKTPIFVACRIYDYDEGLRLDLPVVRIDPLDDVRIEQFARRRLRELADIFLRALNTDARKEMATNPYFLAMMTEVFEEQMRLPGSLHDLYEKYMDVRYAEYAKRGLMQLPWEQLKTSLQDLAFRMIEDNKGTVAELEWVQQHTQPMVLRDGISLGALVQDEETGLVRFYHQSLQGYFALPGLTQALGPGSPVEDRERFIYQIGHLRKAGAPAVPAIIEVLGDRNSSIRRAAAMALGMIGEPAAEIVPVLITALHDKSRHVYMAATSALGWVGASAVEAVPALAAFLENEHAGMCEVAADALGFIGEPAMLVLTGALNSKNEDRRKAAAIALGRVGAPAVPMLIEALGDESERVRGAAIFSLGIIGPPAAEAAPELIASLGDENVSVRRTAAWALADIGSFVATEAVPALAKALDDENAGVRREAAKALGQVEAPAAETVPVLASALGDENIEVKDAVVWALGEVGKPAVPALIEALSDQRPEVRAAAADTLGHIGTPAAEAVPVLAKVLRDETIKDVYMAAWEALKGINTLEAWDALRQTRRDVDV